jgi:hypothetical protein
VSTDAKSQRWPIEEQSTAASDGACVELGVLAQQYVLIKAGDFVETGSPYECRAADKQGAAKHHLGCQQELRERMPMRLDWPLSCDSVACRRALRRVDKELSFLCQLSFLGRITEGLDTTEHDTDIRMVEKCFFDSAVQILRDEIIVVEKVNKISLYLLCPGVIHS